MEQQKKKRSENWSTEEKDILRELISQSRHIIEDKCTKASSNIKKAQEWKNIAKKINELTGKNRSDGEIKLAWKRMKLASKANLSAHRQYQMQTGGGEKPKSPSQEDLAIMAIAPHDFVVEYNDYDSDARKVELNSPEDIAGPSIVSPLISSEFNDATEAVLNQGPLPPPALTDKLRLYHVEMNPYGHRVQLILEAKKARYEVYKLDPLRLPEWFRSKNPRLKIPVLEIPTENGDKYLFESVVICDYLDEKYTRNQLHSRDPYVKAQDRLLIERFNELIKGSLECFDTNFAFGSEQIIQTLDIFEKELASRGTNYFSGNRPGMLDYMIWPWVERLYLLRCVNERKFDEKRGLFPNFADWGDQMQLDDVVKKHANSPQEYFDYYKNARTHSMGYYL